MLGQSWVGYDAVKAKLNIWMFWKGTKGWCHTENEKSRGGRAWQKLSFSKISLRISFVKSCLTLTNHFLFRVLFSKHEIDRKIFLFSNHKIWKKGILFLVLKHEIFILKDCSRKKDITILAICMLPLFAFFCVVSSHKGWVSWAMGLACQSPQPTFQKFSDHRPLSFSKDKIVRYHHDVTSLML